MSRFTKKYMVEDYERLHDHAELLELYLYDSQRGENCDVRFTEGKGENRVHVELYRATGAMGGYVVIRDCMANIFTLDDAIRRFSDNHSEYSLPLRIALEKCSVVRGRLLDEKYGKVEVTA